MSAGRSLLAEGHEALLNDVPLGLGEGPATGQPVDGVEHGVNHDGSVVAAGEQRRTLGDEGQHGRAQIAVQSQGHLGGAERCLEEVQRNTEDPNWRSWGFRGTKALKWRSLGF